ncbi:MAG: ISNCY family transposase [bacterium]
MRRAIKRQRSIGSIDIGKVEFDTDCRHEIIPVLEGLRYIYGKEELLKKVLKLIEQDILGDKSKGRGANGLEYWEILVLTCVRQGCNLNYDALQDLANNHTVLRQMLGLGELDKKRYTRSTLQGNIAKISDETLEKISQLVIDEGHKLCPRAIERVRIDGYVMKTNIHYPTDARLILDGIGKMLNLVCQLVILIPILVGYQRGHWWGTAKKVCRSIQRLAAKEKESYTEKMKGFYRELIEHALRLTIRCEETIEGAKKHLKRGSLKVDSARVKSLISELEQCIALTRKACYLAERRVILEEQIPHDEKIFSLFETHTELINRGKSPYPIEFGHPILIVQDRVGFILKAQIMDHTTEKEVVVPALRQLQQHYEGKIKAVSSDKGFYSHDNLIELQKIIPLVCLPKPGKLSEEDKQRESAPEFGKVRKWHSGIESAIHALGTGNGLALCRDKKYEGYRRYLALGVLARNVQVLGSLLLKKAKRHQIHQAKAAA